MWSLRTLSCCSSKPDLQVEKSRHYLLHAGEGMLGGPADFFLFVSVGDGTQNLEHVRCSLTLTELSFLNRV